MRGKTARIGGGDGQFHRRLARVVEMLPRFQLQRAVGGDLKTRVAHLITMRVAAVGVGGGQLADRRAVLALGNQAGGKRNIRRRMILRRAVRDGGSRHTLRVLVMRGVVVVGRLHRDFRALLRGGEGKRLRGRARDGLAVGEPLITHVGRHTISVADLGG